MTSVYHDIDQNTDAWLEMRAGKITSSKMATVMAHFGKDFGDPAKVYAQDVAIERFTGKRIERDSYKSAAMQRGHELEPIARDLYERDSMEAPRLFPENIPIPPCMLRRVTSRMKFLL